MESFAKAFRILLVAVIVINAVTLIVYFRIQERRLGYAYSKLQREMQEASRSHKELARQVLDQAGRDNVAQRARQLGLEFDPKPAGR